MKRVRVEKRATILDYREVISEIGLPVKLLPAFGMKGAQPVTIRDNDEIEELARQALSASTIGEVLVQRVYS